MAESSSVQLWFSCAVISLWYWQARSSSNTTVSNKTHIWIAGIPVVILMVCAVFPLPEMLPESPWVNLLHLSCTLRSQRHVWVLAGQASHARLLNIFATPDASSDGDAFPVNRKKAQITKHHSNLHLAKTCLYLHCKMFPPPSHRHFKHKQGH